MEHSSYNSTVVMVLEYFLKKLKQIFERSVIFLHYTFC